MSAPGSAYYTVILAELVGATGRVTAIEFDGELAARATANFAQTPHVRVVPAMARESCSNPSTSINAA
jgi:protein-L-isoaspartate(D-aspartate) O-methyltransferase